MAFTTAPTAPFPTDAGTVAPVEVPGIFQGQAIDMPTYGLQLTSLALRLYVMNAKSLHAKGIEGSDADGVKCSTLTSDGGTGNDASSLVPNVDYWALPPIPAQAFQREHTYVLALTGCTSDGVADYSGACGTDDATGQLYTPTGTPGLGNLKVLVLDLDRQTPIASDEIGVSVAHLSPQWMAESIWNPGLAFITEPPLEPLFVNSEDLLDAGVAAADGGWIPFGPRTDGGIPFDRDSASPTPLVKLKGVLTGSAFISPSDRPFPGVELATRPMKLNANGGVDGLSVQAFSTNGTTGVDLGRELYVNGSAYTFLFVGNPSAIFAEAGPSRIHFIGIPNNAPR